jgi:hypothetical protein
MNEASHLCPQCRNHILIPAELNEPARVELADFLRSSRRKIETMEKLMQMYGMGLRDAKALVAHITAPRGHCANCASRLPGGGITHCPSCSALNLNW